LTIFNAYLRKRVKLESLCWLVTLPANIEKFLQWTKHASLFCRSLNGQEKSFSPNLKNPYVTLDV